MIALREFQTRSRELVRDEYRRGKRAVVLVVPTGGGKCLELGTPVLRFDGTIVAVEDVRAGDLLMGPDSRPRRVLSTTTGTGPLYRITPARGEPWVCNDVHVLTLVHTQTGDVVDIDLQSYLDESKTFRHEHKQFAPESGVDFEPADALPLDPYFLGVWYGDGTKSLAGVAISKPDPEIERLAIDVAAGYGLRVRTDRSRPCPTHHIVGERGAGNPLLVLLRSIVGAGTHLPNAYLTASRSDRLSFLAGLLDTDGYLHRSGFEIVQKQRGFADGVCFLARSLGLRALIAAKDMNGARYWRVSISGDCSAIPTRIPRKQTSPRRQIKCATRTGFAVEPIGTGKYAGFELDGDGRFLLGDFTVTHNTVISASIMADAARRGTPTLFLTDRRELFLQTVATLARFGVTNVRAITADGDTCPAGALVTIASIPTLAGARWRDRLPEAELVIIDECHHAIAPKTWQRLAKAYAHARLLGLTATPQRGDGAALGQVFDALVVGATVRELTDLGYLVPLRTWAPPEPLSAGRLAMSPLDAYQRLGGGRRAIVFSTRREHAAAIAEDLRAGGIASEHVDGSMPESRRDSVLARWRAGELRIVSNVGVLVEGFDDPEVAVAIFARRFETTGGLLQAAGRVLRPHPEKEHAVLIDLCGSVLTHGLPDLPRTYTLEGRGISKPDTFSIRQCTSCGGVFEAAKVTSGKCPTCGAALGETKRKAARAGRGEVNEITRERLRSVLLANLQAAARERGIDPSVAMRAGAALEQRRSA